MNARPDIGRPDWLLAGFDDVRDLFHFAQVSRATYTQSPFLDHRIRPMPERTATLSGGEVDAAVGAIDPQPASYIFHTAFCASTLLASCLDHLRHTLVLKEPLVLSHLAGRKRALDTADSAKWAALSKKVSGLLDRSFAEEAVIVKPSNFANAVITDLLDGNPRRKFILMSCSLRGLLLSILKKQVEAANSMESFLAALLQDSDYLTRVQIRSPDSLSLLQQSVVFWHCQRHQFQVIRSRFAADRCLTTTMEEFLAQPLQTLESINSFLGLDLPPGLLRQTVESGAFTLHSKQQEASYSPEQQKREAQAIAVRYKNELDRAVAWAQPLFDAVPVEALTEFEEPLNGFL